MLVYDWQAIVESREEYVEALSQMEARCRADLVRDRVRLFENFRRGHCSLVCWVGIGLRGGRRLRHRRDRMESER